MMTICLLNVTLDVDVFSYQNNNNALLFHAIRELDWSGVEERKASYGPSQQFLCLLISMI